MKLTFAQMIDEDIDRCFNFLKNSFSEDRGEDLHTELVSKYQHYIYGFCDGLYNYYKEGIYFNMENIGTKSLKENIKAMMYKLIAYKNNGFENPRITTSSGINITNQLTATQTTNITFEEVKKQISEMPGLSEKETKETILKIDEIKAIVDLKETQKTKWQKLTSILAWIADKSVDVGITLLPLILKI